MKLVIDSNVLISALLRNGQTRHLLIRSGLELYMSDFVLNEFERHIDLFVKKTKLSRDVLRNVLQLLIEDIIIVETKEIIPHLSEAKLIMDSIDPDDIPILATALAISSDGIWTDDKHFQLQNIVPIWKTSDLIEKFENRTSGLSHNIYK